MISTFPAKNSWELRNGDAAKTGKSFYSGIAYNF
jgi:hypothetical protein